MRTFMYHRQYPEGKIFDTEGIEAPYPPPPSSGWVEHRGELNMTPEQITDRMVENAVREELKRQGEHRAELEREHVKKYGEAPHMRATNDEIANVMDNKTADGTGKLTGTLHLPKRAAK